MLRKSYFLLIFITFISKSAFGLDGSYAGSWWNPARAGEGIFFEIIEQDPAPFVVAYWFTYADDESGAQAYLVGQGSAQGSAQGNRVVLDTVVTRGGRFGPGFDAGAVAFEPWGTLTADFECENLTLAYGGSSSGTIELQRFKPPPRGVAGDCAPSGAKGAGPGISVVDGAYYGAWWLPARAGEGIFLEIWEDPSGLPQVFAAWFTYRPDLSGAQAWVVGEGPLIGNRADLTAIDTSGPRFGPDFDPGAVSFEPWGYLSVQFLGCGAVQISYDAPGFGRGVLAQEPFLLPVAGAPPCREDSVDFRSEVIYFVLTDRFHNGDPANDGADGGRAGDAWDPNNPLGWHGGDFAGITEKVEQGYFSDLGVTTLWISPVVRQVPAITATSGPNTGRPFPGYHGYWADRFEAVEPHFGTEAELGELVSAAHRHGLKVILDTVVNHAGYGSSLVGEHPSWFRTGGACGGDDRTLCLAGLPDFRQDVPEARAFLDDQVRHWLVTSGADGMRMDTMKHVDDGYWVDFFAPGGAGDPARWWTVGEVFSGDVAQVGRYASELGSPSVFDFPLYSAVVAAVARGGPVAAVAEVFAQDFRHADSTRLTTFVDNHDVKRFVSESLEAGYDVMTARERLDAAISLIFLARGIPSLYYGTEIGMPGGGDPFDFPLGQSNREDMRFDEVAGSPLAARIGSLAAARAAHPALRFGSQATLFAPGAGCTVAASGLDPAADFGAELFVRGSFNGWAASPSAALVNTGGGVYRAALALAAGNHEYKIANADYSIEYLNSGQTTQVGQSITLMRSTTGGANNRLSIPAAGCYRFELVAGADITRPALTVSQLGLGAEPEVFAWARELEGFEPVVAVLNNADEPIDLSTLAGGGIPVGGLLDDGAALGELTGRDHDLSVTAGRLSGTIPARGVLAVVANE